MSGSTLFRSLLWALFALSAVAHVHGQAHRRAPALYFREDNNGSSVSTTGPPSASPSSSSHTSSSVSKSSSPSSPPPTSSSPSPSSSSPSSTSTPSTSSTPATTTSSSTSSSSSSSSSSPSSSSSFSSSSSVSVSSVSTKTAASAQGGVANPKTTPTQTTASNNDVGPDPTDTDDQPTTSDDGSQNNVNAASTGFWGNKGAVGATFAVVALVVVGILAGLVMILRRRRAAHNSARDTFFDTKGPIDRDPVERQPSPEPSMASRSLRNEPLDAHATAVPNYGAADQYLVDTTDYNVSYPPGAAYAPAADQQQYYADNTQQQYYADNTAQQQQYYTDQQGGADAAYYAAEGNAYESYNQYYSAPVPAPSADAGGYSVSPASQHPSLSPHPYSHPSHASGTPPSAFARDFPGRDSYQQSIDSFYGAAGTAH